MTRPAKAAILSFTEIERDRHPAFNEWHFFEHMPDEFTVEGVVAAERLVATPELQGRRYVTDTALATIQYFGYYFVSQPVRKAFSDIEALGRAVRAADRSFERKGPSAGYRIVGTRSSARVPNPPEVLPFRPHRGVYVTVEDPTQGARVRDLERADANAEQGEVQGILEVPGVAGCWSFRSAKLVEITNENPAPARRKVRVFWLDGDPLAVTDAIDQLRPWDRRDDPHSYATVFRGAFRTIPADSAFNWFAQD